MKRELGPVPLLGLSEPPQRATRARGHAGAAMACETKHAVVLPRLSARNLVVALGPPGAKGGPLGAQWCPQETQLAVTWASRGSTGHAGTQVPPGLQN